MRYLCSILLVFFAISVAAEINCNYLPSPNVHNLNPTELECLHENLRMQEATLGSQKRSLRNYIRERKREERHQNQRLRLQGKCERVRQQIEKLNKRLKQGYTVARGNALDRRLADLKIRKQNYCG